MRAGRFPPGAARCRCWASRFYCRAGRCVFCGSLYPTLREPDFTLELFTALNAPDLTLTMAGRGWEPFEAAAQRAQGVLGARFVRPGLLPPEKAAELEIGADILLSLGNAFDNQMPSKLFSYLGTGKPLLHLAVTDTDPTLPYLAKYPLALVLHKKNGVTPEVVDTLRRWLTDVQGQCLPYAQVAALYPEFTPGVVAQTFIGRI